MRLRFSGCSNRRPRPPTSSWPLSSLLSRLLATAFIWTLLVVATCGQSDNMTEPATDGTEPATDGTEPATDMTEPATDMTDPVTSSISDTSSEPSTTEPSNDPVASSTPILSSGLALEPSPSPTTSTSIGDGASSEPSTTEPFVPPTTDLPEFVSGLMSTASTSTGDGASPEPSTDTSPVPSTEPSNPTTVATGPTTVVLEPTPSPITQDPTTPTTQVVPTTGVSQFGSSSSFSLEPSPTPTASTTTLSPDISMTIGSLKSEVENTPVDQQGDMIPMIADVLTEVAEMAGASTTEDLMEGLSGAVEILDVISSWEDVTDDSPRIIEAFESLVVQLAQKSDFTNFTATLDNVDAIVERIPSDATGSRGRQVYFTSESASLTEPSPDQLDASVTVPDELFQSQDGDTSTPEVAVFVVRYSRNLFPSPLNESIPTSKDARQVSTVTGVTVISDGVEVTALSVPATLRFRVPTLASNGFPQDPIAYRYNFDLELWEDADCNCEIVEDFTFIECFCSHFTTFTCTVGVSVCGNGILEPGEECDNGNMTGCSLNCMVDQNYICTDMFYSTNVTNSSCKPVLLDLNPADNSSLNTTLEISDVGEVVWLVEVGQSEFPFGLEDFTAVYFAILDENLLSDEEVDEFASPEAIDAGRVGMNCPGLARVNSADPANIDSEINGRVVAEVHELDKGSSSLCMFTPKVSYALNVTGYRLTSEEAFLDLFGYNKSRDICLIPVSSSLGPGTPACVSIFYIGQNDDCPTIDCSGVPSSTEEFCSVAVFVEDQTEPLKVFGNEGGGGLVISDQDHPRYGLQSAEASIVDYDLQEELGLLITDSYLNSTFSGNVSFTAGTLFINVSASTDDYQAVLNNLTYFNTMEPQPFSYRTITLQVFDGLCYSNTVNMRVNITNTNDRPVVSLDGGDPSITVLPFNFTEGENATRVIPNAIVLDFDPQDMIARAEIVLLDPLDGQYEWISIQDYYSLALSMPNDFSIVLIGNAPSHNYTTALRSLTYQHTGDNPTTGTRSINIRVTDVAGDTSDNSTVEIYVIPVNDPPVLSFDVDSNETESQTQSQTFTYIEDDPPINFTQDVQVADVDSDISGATIAIAGALNGLNDSLQCNESLFESYSVAFGYDENGSLVLSGTATPTQYQELIRSLSYVNLLTNEDVRNGLRNFTISVRDTSEAPSNSLTVHVDVSRRNDAPDIDLGGGLGMDFSTTFVEDGPSVAIALSHIADIVDEEGHEITGLTANLTSPDAQLNEEEDVIFLRIPMVDLGELGSVNLSATNQSISVMGEASFQFYTSILTNIYYSNTRDEPTFFNESTGERIRRTVELCTKDSSGGSETMHVYINIEPKDDHAPRILINASCASDCRSSGAGGVPNLQSGARLIGVGRKRSVDDADRSAEMKTSSLGRAIRSAASPKLASSHVTVDGAKDSCLHSITLHFGSGTSTPIVEVWRDLGFILHFEPLEVERASHNGYWSDHETLVIEFPDCSLKRWDREARLRDLRVVFEEQPSTESCNITSPCLKGICFRNATGCPVTGSYTINTVTQLQSFDNDVNDSGDETSDGTNSKSTTATTTEYYNGGETVEVFGWEVSMHCCAALLTVAIVLPAVCLMLLVARMQLGRREKRESKFEDTSFKTKSVVIDLSPSSKQQVFLAQTTPSVVKETRVETVGGQKFGKSPPEDFPYSSTWGKISDGREEEAKVEEVLHPSPIDGPLGSHDWSCDETSCDKPGDVSCGKSRDASCDSLENQRASRQRDSLSSAKCSL